MELTAMISLNLGIFNRLPIPMRLQLDSTINYPLDRQTRTASVAAYPEFSLLGAFAGYPRTLADSILVPRKGLEPSRLAAHGPEPCASTNSATWAGDRGLP